MKLMNVKGTYDYLTSDMELRRRIMNVLIKNFSKYGYSEIETPIINYYDLLSYKYSDDAEILNEIYRLTDQGDRDLGLRYDLTVPFCKVVGMYKDLRMPFRRFEIGRVFRNGPVKPGRTREFYQCDVDVVGIDNRVIEAEQILMALDTYKELGIDVICKYNNRKLMSGIILGLGIEEDKLDSVISVIDKLEKVSRNELNDMLLDLGIDIDNINKLFDIFSMELVKYDEISFDNKAANDIFREGLSEIKELNGYLTGLGIIDNCKFSPTLARGLSIYTGIVFEFYDSLGRCKSAIGGGGRYNKIITNFMDNGKEYPACGLSFGLEPIFYILNNDVNRSSLIDVYIVPLGNTIVSSMKVASMLRENNFNVLIEMNNKKISKCFEYADKEHIKYVMIIGEDEVESGIYKIKNMIEKKEYSLKLDELLDKIERE